MSGDSIPASASQHHNESSSDVSTSDDSSSPEDSDSDIFDTRDDKKDAPGKKTEKKSSKELGASGAPPAKKSKVQDDKKDEPGKKTGKNSSKESGASGAPPAKTSKSKKYVCPWCHSYLRLLGSKYEGDKVTPFECPFCTNMMTYGEEKGAEFKKWHDWSEDEEMWLEEEVPQKEIKDFQKGDAVEVTVAVGKVKTKHQGWLVEKPVQATRSRIGRSTRSKSTPVYVFSIVDTEGNSHTYSKNASIKSQGTDHPNLQEFKRKEGHLKIKKKLKREEDRICEDVVSGRHPKWDVVVQKFKTAMYYETMKCLAPGAWVNEEVINFYFQLLVDEASSEWNRIHVFNTYFVEASTGGRVNPKKVLFTPHSHLPHTFLTPYSHLTHTSLTPYSHLTHTLLTPYSHTYV